MSEEIVTVIVVRRDGSSFTDSSVLVTDNMFEGVEAWLDPDPDKIEKYMNFRRNCAALEAYAEVSKENSVGIAGTDQNVEIK